MRVGVVFPRAVVRIALRRSIERRQPDGSFERVAVTAKSVLTLQSVHGSFREVEVRDPATLDVVRTAGCPDKGDYLTDFAAADANVQRLTQLKQFRRIVAPFDGVITRRSIEVGDLVAAAGNDLGPAGNCLVDLIKHLLSLH